MRTASSANQTATACLLTDVQAAAVLGISRRHLHTLVDRGVIRRIKLGRAARYRVRDVQRLADHGAAYTTAPDASAVRGREAPTRPAGPGGGR